MAGVRVMRVMRVMRVVGRSLRLAAVLQRGLLGIRAGRGEKRLELWLLVQLCCWLLRQWLVVVVVLMLR